MEPGVALLAPLPFHAEARRRGEFRERQGCRRISGKPA